MQTVSLKEQKKIFFSLFFLFNYLHNFFSLPFFSFYKNNEIKREKKKALLLSSLHPFFFYLHNYSLLSFLKRKKHD